MKIVSRIRSGLRALKLSELSWAFAKCPFCGPTIFLELNSTPSGLRCIRCAASTVHISLGLVLRETCPELSGLSVCELSAIGPYTDFLARTARSARFSEYSAEVNAGETHNGVQCEDVQRLTYADETFDLITHTEVMEHVPNDALAFTELLRVLKRKGRMLFTVPFSGLQKTLERASGFGDDVKYFMEPAYHLDPWKSGAGILAYRDYGLDIVEKLVVAGFVEVRIASPRMPGTKFVGRDVVVATRP